MLPQVSDHDQMLAAILAAPDDDAPRRAYAEWLTRRGDPRGEFITLQLLDGDNHADWRAAAAADAIRQQHGAGWVPPIKGLSVSAFRRGFPDVVFMSGEDFVAGAEALFRLAPVRGVALFQPGPQLGRIAALPQLAKLRRLDLGDGVDTSQLAALAASPWIADLATLELRDSPIGDDGAGALAQAAGLRRLETLVLVGCQIGPEGVRRLAGSPILARLSYLNLAGNTIGTGMAALSAWPDPPGPAFVAPPPPDTGVAALAASPQLGPLRRLYLPRCELGDEDIAALAASPRFEALEELVLDGNLIRDAGAAALASSPGLGRLVTLRLGHNLIGDAGAAAFAAATGLRRLARLDLTENSIHDAGGEALAAGAGLPALATLGLSHNPIYVPGLTEDWLDGDAVVGAGPVNMSAAQLHERFGRRFNVE